MRPSKLLVGNVLEKMRGNSNYCWAVHFAWFRAFVNRQGAEMSLLSHRPQGAAQ
jgi:hypothetical protein